MNKVEEELTAGLNPVQKEAVTAPPGPMLILAGAGSGKTRVLTRRIAWLIAVHGASPWEIAALTFTNKAAQEMGERASTLVPENSAAIQVSTFHSLCSRILRREIEHLGYRSSFVIYDDSDQLAMLRRVLDELKLSRSAREPALFRRLIDGAKNRLEGPQEVSAPLSGPGVHFPEVYARYQEMLRRANAIDFGDIIMLCVHLFERHEAVRERYLNRYRHLLIDEYQDTNHAQYRLAKLLTRDDRPSLCVVGDEDQSIYSFRGADISNILSFQKDYPEARVLRLERNYRSTQPILSAASAVVEHNESRLGKTLWTDRTEGERIRYMEAEFDTEEASMIAEEIQRLRQNRALAYGDIAIFYRANNQSRPFEEVFAHRGIPIRLVGPGFYDRKEIKDIRAYLSLVYNAFDDAAFERILNEPPRGIGARSRAKLLDIAYEKDLCCWDAAGLVVLEPERYGTWARKIAEFYRTVEDIRARAGTLRVHELIDFILDRSGYRRRLEELGDVESEARLDNLRELSNVAAELNAPPGFDGLRLFLERISLRSQADEAVGDEGRVTLMTLHNAKGLEFPIVFMTGMEDGLLPHSRTLDDREQLEEERRLCYVGMTRAMKQLYLTRARRRRLRGTLKTTIPSRFVKEIPAELLDIRRSTELGKLVGRFAAGLGGYRRGVGAETHPPPRPRLMKTETPVRGRDIPRRPSTSTACGADLQAWIDKGLIRKGLGGSGKRSTSAADPVDPVIPTGVQPACDRDMDPSQGEEHNGNRRRASIMANGDDNPFRDFKVGRQVVHPAFGEGVIKAREGPDDNPRLSIFFRASGTKRIMARYAALELVYPSRS